MTNYLSTRQQKTLSRVIALVITVTMLTAGSAFAIQENVTFFSKVDQNYIELKQDKESRIDVHTFLIRNEIYNLIDYIRWAQENVRYTPDGDRDHWASPEETIEKKSGDCEDIAFLNAAVLRVFGYSPRVIAYGIPGKDPHVITLFRNGKHYQIFDNTDFYSTKATSVKEFVVFLAMKHKAKFLLELSQGPNHVDVIYAGKFDQDMLAALGK